MKTYLIDLDGTMYSGNKNIEGAIEFIDYLQKNNKPYIFLTNNATRTKKQIKEHMINLGFKNINENDFFTSAMAAAKYAAKNFEQDNKTCFVIGEEGLVEALKKENFEVLNCDVDERKANFVFIGLDRKADYKKYSIALHHVLNGAKLIATNTDRLLSNNNTFDLGNGAAVNMIEYASSRESLKVGKPYPIILNILLDEFSLEKEDLILVGDNLETDIKLGYDSKIETIMVCTGVHSEKDVDILKIYPTSIIKNLKELM